MKTKILITILALYPLFTNSQTSSDIDKIIHEEMVRQNLPGLAVGVYNRGTISLIKGYGHLDVNRTKPITTNTTFRWASISKTLTAVAALQLIENKSNVSINDKVTEHYPHWIAKFGSKTVSDKSRKQNITLKQLFTHRSGINHYKKGVNYRKSNYKSDSDHFNANSSVDVFRNLPLESNPGSTYKYTTYGYNLLGAVVDKISGSYPNWVKNNIANRLGMSSLKVGYGKFTGYQKKTDGVINSLTENNHEWVLPGGGWESNIGDLLKFARGIMDKRLLSDTEALWKGDGYKNSKGGKQEYRRGVSTAGTGSSLRIWHGGSHANLTTLMYIIPSRNISVVVMIPMQSADRWNIVRRIVNKMGISRPFNASPLDKCNSSMKSSSKKFVGVWKKTNKDVIIRRGFSSANFAKEWNYLKSKEYHVEDIEYTSQGWNGIFKKGTGQYAMWRNYDHTGFNTKWKQMNSQGYRLYDLETYVVNGKRKWAGLFKKGTGKYALHRSLSASAFGTKRNELTKQGYKLIDIEVYSSSGTQKWAGVWVAGKDELLNRNYNYTDFKKLVSSRKKSGYQLLDAETYVVNGSRKWAGIWEKSNLMISGMSTPQNYCDMMNTHDANSKNGWELIEFEMY